jgi:hypothetical protein
LTWVSEPQLTRSLVALTKYSGPSVIRSEDSPSETFTTTKGGLAVVSARPSSTCICVSCIHLASTTQVVLPRLQTTSNTSSPRIG